MPGQHLFGTDQDRTAKQVPRIAAALMPPIPDLSGALLPVDQLTAILKPLVQATPRPQQGFVRDLDDLRARAGISPDYHQPIRAQPPSNHPVSSTKFFPPEPARHIVRPTEDQPSEDTASGILPIRRHIVHATVGVRCQRPGNAAELLIS